MKIVKKENLNSSGSLAKRDSFSDLFKEMDSFFGDFERSWGLLPGKLFNNNFAVDVSENDKRILIKAELPGLHEKDISVLYEDGVLHINAQKHEEQENEGNEYYRKEIRSGLYSRSFQLPDAIDADAVSASFKDGVLTVEVPKVEEKIIKKEITVNKK